VGGTRAEYDCPQVRKEYNEKYSSVESTWSEYQVILQMQKIIRMVARCDVLGAGLDDLEFLSHQEV
jgi:hypothetical protein